MGLNQIQVKLVDHMGDDLSTVNSARVSFDKASEFETIEFNTEAEMFKWFDEGGKGYYDLEYVMSDRWYGGHPVNVLSEKDAKLTKYLADHRHLTPFRHNAIQIRCTAPIFLARQLGKHQAGLSWNEVSRRYVDTPPEFYTPDEWRGRPEGSIKQGSSGAVHKVTIDGVDYQTDEVYDNLTRVSLITYEAMLESGVAPEMARMVLPQSMMTTWIWSGNLLAFTHVYKERIAEGAQLEAQHFAKELGVILEQLFPVSFKALKGE
jgi:thymidylate synthase (FAD)